jgi:DNA-binding MarR family transcriptional regulator
MEELEDLKVNNPSINLIALLDQTNDIIYRAQELELLKYRITLQQVKVLFVILKREKGQRISFSDLGELLLREHNSVSTLMARMEKAGLIKKEKDLKEKKTYVRATAKGRNIINKLTQNSIECIVSTLTPEEITVFKSCLRKLRQKGIEVLGLDLKPPILR